MRRLTFVLLIIVVPMLSIAAEVAPPAPLEPAPTERQLAWHPLAWHALEFYGLIHYTVNTYTDRDGGNGQERPSVFNPTALERAQLGGETE